MALNTHHSTTTTIKFLCSYGGKILPRYPDGKLRYHGGQTRVLAVHRSISFSDLLVKLGELCGTSATLRCQLPTEDLDALVSITSDEDLVNLIEEYDHQSTRQSKSLKIRAFLSLPKRSSPSPSPSPSRSTASGSSSSGLAAPSRPPLSYAAKRIQSILVCFVSLRYRHVSGEKLKE
ncbi:putative PB1 domain-containing protein [Helianthus annuus]|nr:putative PB1 domain-containing protein [Helianthus annuus]